MEHERAGYWWRNRELEDANEKTGQFGLEDVQPFLKLVFQVDGYLLLSTPHIKLDFTGNGRGEVEMEIHDTEGMHIAVATPEQANEVTRRAMQDWDAHVLRRRLCDLPIDWMCTSAEYA